MPSAHRDALLRGVAVLVWSFFRFDLRDSGGRKFARSLKDNPINQTGLARAGAGPGVRITEACAMQSTRVVVIATDYLSDRVGLESCEIYHQHLIAI